VNSAGLYKIVSTLASATFSFIDDKTAEGRKNIFNYLKDHLDTVKISLIGSQMQEFSEEELEKWDIQKNEYEREFKVTV
jgi:thioredoxin-related protein